MCWWFLSIQQVSISNIQRFCDGLQFYVCDKPFSAFDALYCVFIQVKAIYLKERGKVILRNMAGHLQPIFSDAASGNVVPSIPCLVLVHTRPLENDIQ